jgi:hypothetical protein
MKPTIITPCTDTDTTFQFWSGGWYETSIRHTPEAQALMALAKKCINDGENVPDVIRRLEEAGFKVIRSDNPLDGI